MYADTQILWSDRTVYIHIQRKKTNKHPLIGVSLSLYFYKEKEKVWTDLVYWWIPFKNQMAFRYNDIINNIQNGGPDCQSPVSHCDGPVSHEPGEDGALCCPLPTLYGEKQSRQSSDVCWSLICT